MEFVSKLAGGKGGSQGAILQGIMGLVSNQGGLSGLLGKFNAAGMSDKTESWVSTGDNQPVSGQEVRRALGDQEISRFAQQAGVSEDEASNQLASVLPDAVDQLTPEGKVPDQSRLQQMLGSFGV